MESGPAEGKRQYFQRRLAQEEAAARNATDARVRNSHLEMARYYRDACDNLEAAGSVAAGRR